MNFRKKAAKTGRPGKLALYFGPVLLVIIGVLFLISRTEHGPAVDPRFLIAQMNTQKVAHALELYQKDHGDYPATEDMPLALLRSEEGKPAYLDSFPHDGWGQPYIYKRTPDAAQPFMLYSIGANHADENGLGDDLDYWKIKDQKVVPE